MSSPVTDLLSAYYCTEMADHQDVLCAALAQARPDARENLRLGFRALLTTRPMTVKDFWKATSAWFADDDQLYSALEDAYRCFFEEQPPTPDTRTFPSPRSPVSDSNTDRDMTP
jgi:hypothetical protein